MSLVNFMYALHSKLFVDLELFYIVEVMRNYRVSAEPRFCIRQFPVEPDPQSAPDHAVDYIHVIIQVCSILLPALLLYV